MIIFRKLVFISLKLTSILSGRLLAFRYSFKDFFSIFYVFIRYVLVSTQIIPGILKDSPSLVLFADNFILFDLNSEFDSSDVYTYYLPNFIVYLNN